VTAHRGTVRRVNGGRVHFALGVQHSYRPPPGVLVEVDVNEKDDTMRIGYFTDPDWFQDVSFWQEVDAERRAREAAVSTGGLAVPPAAVQAGAVSQTTRRVRRWSDGGVVGWVGGGHEYARVYDRDAPYDIVDAMDTLDMLAMVPEKAAQDVIGLGARLRNS
jgi:hypothetical protein